jgi:hypothetical protein
MEESILTSIKKLRGISAEDNAFDSDIITHINKAFTDIKRFNVGPTKAFRISDEFVTWKEFSADEEIVGVVKPYIDRKVHIAFDPPLSSIHMASLEKLIAEDEWMLYLLGDTPRPETEEDEYYYL